jgi:cystathionine gamma-synthase
VDNTFATPWVCRPIALGVDWVWESVSKMLNGHSDLMLGMVCGRRETWGRLPQIGSTWGLASAPWDCFLAERGLMTFGVRMERACRNAARVAQQLVDHHHVKRVFYPGLASHPTCGNVSAVSMAAHEVCGSTAAVGNVVSFELDLAHVSVEQLIAGSGIPYFPSLGECATTLSHPASSSHRHLSEAQRQTLGITPGTVRLSLGIEDPTVLCEKLEMGLQPVATSAQGRV